MENKSPHHTKIICRMCQAKTDRRKIPCSPKTSCKALKPYTPIEKYQVFSPQRNIKSTSYTFSPPPPPPKQKKHQLYAKKKKSPAIVSYTLSFPPTSQTSHRPKRNNDQPIWTRLEEILHCLHDHHRSPWVTRGGRSGWGLFLFKVL